MLAFNEYMACVAGNEERGRRH